MDPLVALLAATEADLVTAEEASKALVELDVPHTVEVVDAHLHPERVADVVATAEQRGCEVLVCVASGAAHLAGLVAARTSRPVIGVPCRTPHLGGADALYGTVQAPEGTPVATVGLDQGRNAAILAAQILAVAHADVAAAVRQRRDEAASQPPTRREIGTGGDDGRTVGFGFQPG